jgi:hypothetical protein
VTNRDLENGLTLDALIESNLCTDIMVLVAIKYVSMTREMVVVDKGTFLFVNKKREGKPICRSARARWRNVAEEVGTAAV